MKRRTLVLSMIAAPTVARADEDITVAQPELPKEKLTIVTRDGQKREFNVEMALTPQQQETGLMFRKSVPEDGGMLFDWGSPRESLMWMRNTVAPLDMLFINADGTIRRIAENTTPHSLATIDSGGPVRATLELARRDRAAARDPCGRQGGAAGVRQQILNGVRVPRRGCAARRRTPCSARRRARAA